jgi:amino-acid N-acetyltransferase
MIRKARMTDVKGIQKIVEIFAKRDQMLPRSLVDIYENLRDYFICQRDDSDEIIGVVALHFCWENLAEVRSMAVTEENQRHGIGRKLVQTCLAEARNFDIKTIFALTYIPEFFEVNGFRRVDKAMLPHKIWSDCVKCPQFPECKEIAVAYEVEPGPTKSSG